VAHTQCFSSSVGLTVGELRLRLTRLFAVEYGTSLHHKGKRTQLENIEGSGMK
jgi:hypothetical protein